MMWSRSEINRLGDRIREVGLGDDDRAKLLEYRATFLPAYEHVVRRISEDVPSVKLTGRPEKTPDSIVAKLRRSEIELARMQDVAGCRLVVEQTQEQDELIARLVSIFPTARIVDRRSRPSFGYRGVHVIPMVDDRQVEIQVRTFLQDIWANVSEDLADRLGSGLKYGNVPPGADAAKKVLDRSSEMIAAFENSKQSENRIFKDAGRSQALSAAFLAIMAVAIEEAK